MKNHVETYVYAYSASGISHNNCICQHNLTHGPKLITKLHLQSTVILYDERKAFLEDINYPPFPINIIFGLTQDGTGCEIFMSKHRHWRQEELPWVTGYVNTMNQNRQNYGLPLQSHNHVLLPLAHTYCILHTALRLQLACGQVREDAIDGSFFTRMCKCMYIIQYNY